MLVICEECAKKYNVDERKIKGERATFHCKQCSHQIIVQKPRQSTVKLPNESRQESMGQENDNASVAAPATQGESGAKAVKSPAPPRVTPQSIKTGPSGVRKKKKTNMSVGFYFLVAMLIGFAAITGGIGYLYFFYIPEVTGKPVDLEVLSSSLSLTIVVAIWFIGIISFFFLARFITKPLQELTAIVHRISLGELDLTIEPKGPREIQELAKACDRMRYSIKEAIKRLKSK
ncbi:MAG: zinc-ribbon domain-containing protein [Desulfobulbaceae bacterium]|nr:zinc-ribbon domain-containing protein [Desulfobulbaceae bacterium]